MSIFYIAAALLLCGCATRYQVLTNTYMDPAARETAFPPGTSFTVLSNDSAPNAIFDEEIRNKIEKMLVSKGYTVAPIGSSYRAIQFGYDISGRTETVSWPTFDSANPRSLIVTNSNAYLTTDPGSTYVSQASSSYTLYTARLFLKVLDTASLKAGSEKTVWVGDTMNESMNPDLRDSIDYLLVGTFRYMGKDTGKGRSVTLDQNDPEVLGLRRYSAAPKTG